MEESLASHQSPSPCLHCGTLISETSQSPLRGSGFCCGACELLYDLRWVQGASSSLQHQNLPEAYQPFEKEELRRIYDLSPRKEVRHYRLFVEGLQCSSCVHLLESLPQYLPGVSLAHLNFGSSELQVRTDESLSLGKLLTFIGSMGYKSHPLNPGEDQSELLKNEDRDLLRRLAVAGACAGNIMLFTIPIYAGLEGAMASWFMAASFLLFLPVLLYSAIPIYRGAWSALAGGRLNVDLALALAFLGGFLASAANWIRGSDGVYFDSSAGFLFLILVSRWFLKNSQRRWIQSPLAQLPWMHSFLHLKIGDSYSLKSGECVPTDSELKSRSALFDTSWMTGESLPVVLQTGMRIPAGYRLLSAEADFLAKTLVKESEIAKGLRRIEADSLKDSYRINTFDRAARILLASVFILSALMMAFGPWIFSISLNEAFERSLSLLIVACPCALAFGGPLAYAMTLRKASEKGLLIKNADVLDQVADCTEIIFDKTGTLTHGKLELIGQHPASLPSWIKDLILSLEKHSLHPVAFAFREAWKDHNYREIPVRDVHEVPGERIFGLFEGQIYSLQKAAALKGGIKVQLKRGDELIASFEFEDQPRREAKALLTRLSRRFEMTVLSGDREDRVQRLIALLGIKKLTGRGDCLPQDKADFVRRRSHLVMMVGDGANDSEALAAAHVGVAVSGSLEQGLKVASVYLLTPGLNSLLDLFAMSQKARHLVNRNLSFALAYNVGAGIAALLGFVNPLLAAILMPISSLLILFSTWEASR